jgi:paraquat-inducible protein B
LDSPLVAGMVGVIRSRNPPDRALFSCGGLDGLRAPVLVEFVRRGIRVGEEGQRFQDQRVAVQRLIQRGLRASLRMQSFVTGLLYVALDVYPDTPSKLRGLDPTHPELPTIPSDMDQLKSTLQQGMAELKKLPLEAVFAEVLTLLQRANALLELPELKQALVTLQDVMTGARQLLHNADAQVEVLGSTLGGPPRLPRGRWRPCA